MPKRKISSHVVGLTGGLGSGKSTVLTMFKAKGARTVDSDKIVHRHLNQKGLGLKKIRKTFGPNVFDAKGKLVRKKLASIVFSSSRKRKQLEKILHPLVRKEIKKAIQAKSRKVLICDIPLLFESGWHKTLRNIVVVNATHAQRVKRLLKRGLDKKDISARFKAQWPLSQKVKKANFVINNNKSLSHTRKQVSSVWTQILNYQKGK